MQTREPLHNRVYKDLLSQIYEGILPYNSTLPTLFSLRHTYGVSDNSIRAALVQLRKRGYISTARGRGAQVIFDVNAPEAQKKLPQAFTCDKKNIYAFYDAINVLFPSLYMVAAFNCKAKQLEALAQIVEALPRWGESCTDYVELYIQFHKIFFSSMKNELITHIVTTVMHNTMLPATLILRQTTALQEDFWQASNSMRNVYAAILQKDAESIKKCWKQLIAITDQTAKKVVESCQDIPEKGENTKVGLQYAHAFKYLLIAHDLYQRILEGEYAVGDYLPTIEQCTKRYTVGAVTVRRAYHLLEESKLTKTENGRGTRVASLSIEDNSLFDASFSTMNKTSYLEVLAFLWIVCGDLLRSGIALASSIQEVMEEPLNPKHRYSTIILCKEVMKGASTPAIYELYQTISQHLFWDVHQKKYLENKIFVEEKHRRCLEIVSLIEAGCTDQAIFEMRELITMLANRVGSNVLPINISEGQTMPPTNAGIPQHSLR